MYRFSTICREKTTESFVFFFAIFAWRGGRGPNTVEYLIKIKNARKFRAFLPLYSIRTFGREKRAQPFLTHS